MPRTHFIRTIATGSTKIKIENPDTQLWLERMAEKGWTVPTWPKEYGGAGLTIRAGQVDTPCGEP